MVLKIYNKNNLNLTCIEEKYIYRYISLQYKSNLNYFYYIFSTPLIVWIVSSQKLTLLTSSIICLVIVIISVKKSLNKKVLFFIYSALSFCIFSKISNLVPSLIIFSYLLYLFFKKYLPSESLDRKNK